MTNAEIETGFQKTIDQFYAFRNTQYIRETQLHFIGGVLQAALHILPTDRYFALKDYIYTKYGYDPGGCKYGEMSLDELTGGY